RARCRTGSSESPSPWNGECDRRIANQVANLTTSGNRGIVWLLCAREVSREPAGWRWVDMISCHPGRDRIVAPFQPTKFESVCFSVSCSPATVVVLLIYRPGSESVTEIFFTELTKYLEAIALYKCQIVIAGDLNIH